MQTNQAIYFVLLVLSVFLWMAFGPYPLGILIAMVIGLLLWLRYARPRVWKGNGYVVRVEQALREEAWVDYEENGQRLSFRAIWAKGKNPELWIEVNEQVYSPPDYHTPLSDERLAEIQGRIAVGLKNMRIRHKFDRIGKLTV
jgi:hypothetical protein